jgi:hypothetical protein
MRQTLLTITLLAALSACGDEGDSGGDGANTNNGGANNGVNNGQNNGANNGQNNGANNGQNNGDVNNGVAQPEGGPNALVELAQILDPAGLELELDVEGSGLVESQGAQVYLLNFTFTSHTWAGGRWRHQASLYLPTGAESGDLLGVVNRQEGGGFGESFGIAAAAQRQAPILILNDTPPLTDLTGAGFSAVAAQLSPRCKGGPLGQVDVLTRCLFEAVWASGDASLDPFLHMAIVYLRGITAVQALPEAILAARLDQRDPPPPPFGVRRAALMGDAWRAPALPIAAAVDPRVVGIFLGGGAFGALPESFALQREVWPDGHPLGDPARWVAFLESPAGATYQEALDPAAWPPALLQGKPALYTWGTQMTASPLRAFELYGDALDPALTTRLAIRDYGDGIGSDLHLPMWQVFLQMADGKRPTPRIAVTAQDNRGNVDVSARLELPEGAQVASVVMLYVQRHRDRDDEDFRDAIWEVGELEAKDNGTWNGTFAPLSKNTAVVVLVQDTAGDPPSDALTSSAVQVLALP